jgi:hypothetical protein
MSVPFQVGERRVHSVYPYMLTENPTELLTEELTDDRPKI